MMFKKNLFRSLTATVAIATSTLLWSVYHTRHPKVRRYDLEILPEGSREIKFLHIGDFHYLPSKDKWLKKWFAELDLSDIDLVISTGDNAGAKGINADIELLLKPAFNKTGVFVFGSNDYYAPKPKNPLKYFFSKSPVDLENSKSHIDLKLDIDTMRDIFTSHGWTDVNNSATVLDLPQVRLEIIGIDDPHINKQDFEKAIEVAEGLGVDFSADTQLQKQSKPSDKPVLRLGVGHAPYIEVIERFESLGCDISFFGHTHGGQLCLPLWGALVSNCDLPPVFASGFYPVEKILHYINSLKHSWYNCVVHKAKRGYVSITAGLGTSPVVPLRFACPPEVSIITVKPKLA